MAAKATSRHTILLPEDLEDELRRIQADRIKSSMSSVSLSSVINQLVREGLEKRSPRNGKRAKKIQR